jgi:molybdenum cofactor guanylyltransferase
MTDLRPLTRAEIHCLSAARARITRTPGNDPHTVAAAVLTEAGNVYAALNMHRDQTWGGICGETAALSKALRSEPNARIIFSAAVDRTGLVLIPSQVCLGLFAEYAPLCRFAIAARTPPDDAVSTALADLMAQRAARPGIPAVILAGGAAQRMGGGDKGRLVVGGRSLFDRVMTRIGPQAGRLALNANGDPRRFDDLGLPVLPDSLPDRPGPLAGVLTAMDWAVECGADAVVTVAADTPFFPTTLLAGLMAAAGPSGLCLAASPDPTGQVQRHPTFGLWPVALRHDLRQALRDGLRKVVIWTDRHQAGEAIYPSLPFDPFFNVNTPADLATAESLLT